MAYQYRGTQFEVEPEPTNGCGTYAGYRAHIRRHEPTCRECKDAANAYWRDNYQARKNQPRKVYTFNPENCGTSAGYARHQFYNVEPCTPCRRAAAQYIADYRARRAA